MISLLLFAFAVHVRDPCCARREVSLGSQSEAGCLTDKAIAQLVGSFDALNLCPVIFPALPPNRSKSTASVALG